MSVARKCRKCGAEIDADSLTSIPSGFALRRPNITQIFSTFPLTFSGEHLRNGQMN